MIKRTHFLVTRLVMLLLVINIGVVTAELKSTRKLTSTEAAAALLEPWLSDDAPGVAVAVMQNGDTVFSAGRGLANLEFEAPITPETVFNVASVSKQFTAFASLLLVSEGKIALEDDIRSYLPELQEMESKIKLGHLLDHMSGVREHTVLTEMSGWLEDDIRTNNQIMRLLARQKTLNFEPGTRYEYSNSGYFLLSQIVERVSGQSFSDFAKEHIFEPLGMNQTQFYTDRSEWISGRADSYATGREGFRKFISVSENTGSTGLHTTAMDLLKWARNFETRQLGTDQVFSLMQQRTTTAYGEPAILGRGQELRPYNGMQTWSHGGRDAGYRSFLLRIPESGFSLAILSNRADFDTAKLAFALADIFLHDTAAYQKTKTPDWTPASQENLIALTGEYELYPGMIFSISYDQGTLRFAALNSTDYVALPQIGERRFSLNPNADISLEFELNNKGQAIAFYYTIGLHGRLKASRIRLDSFDPSTAELEEFTGIYFSDEVSTQYELMIEDGTLFARHHRLPAIPLTAYQSDVFSSPANALRKLEFVRDQSGVVIGCRVSGVLVNRVEFKRLITP